MPMIELDQHVMTAPNSNGDGRRMTLAEAVGRRRRMAARFGSITVAQNRGAERAWLGPNGGRIGHEFQDRRWAKDFCQFTDRLSAISGGARCEADANDVADIGLFEGVPVAMCARCRYVTG